MVFPDLAIFVGEPVFLLAQPVRLVRARLGDEVNFKACFFEDIERVEGFGDEESCKLLLAGVRDARAVQKLPVSLPSG